VQVLHSAAQQGSSSGLLIEAPSDFRFVCVFSLLQTHPLKIRRRLSPRPIAATTPSAQDLQREVEKMALV